MCDSSRIRARRHPTVPTRRPGCEEGEPLTFAAVSEYLPGNPDSNPDVTIVIPVFNSAAVVGDTISATVSTLEGAGEDFEILAVNDGSSDDSWEVIAHLAEDDPRIVAVDLLRNYGQHTAVLAGLQASTGEHVVTIDDDLQNPPVEILNLLETARSGDHDLVTGRFADKRHTLVRRVGSRVVHAINRRVFDVPDDLAMTNVRCIHRSVVDRVCGHRTTEPYINGLVAMYAARPASITVEHHDRRVGQSGYSPRRIASLVARILFNYSAWPLRVVSNIGLLAAVVAVVFGAYALIRALFVGSSVPGWASVAVLLAFFNGVALLIMSMLGEYTVRLLNQMNAPTPYHVRRTVGSTGSPSESRQDTQLH